MDGAADVADWLIVENTITGVAKLEGGPLDVTGGPGVEEVKGVLHVDDELSVVAA